jgi:long-chain acyl-CoA synthetase
VNITHELRRALQVRATGVASIYQDRCRTGREIGDRISRLVGALCAVGLEPGDRIAVLMFNQDRYIECFLTASWPGGVIVPLNIGWSIGANAGALSDCGARLLIVDTAFASAGTILAASAVGSMQLIYADDGIVPNGMLEYEALIAASAPTPDVMAAPDDLVVILYSGDTTGRSKGVMLSHRNIMANTFNVLAEGLFAQTSVYLHAAPMFHAANAVGMYSIFLDLTSSDIVVPHSPKLAVIYETRSRQAIPGGPATH